LERKRGKEVALSEAIRKEKKVVDALSFCRLD